MKIYNIALLPAISITLLSTLPLFAVAQESTSDHTAVNSSTSTNDSKEKNKKMNALVEKINAQISDQEKTIQALKDEVNMLKAEQQGTELTANQAKTKANKALVKSSAVAVQAAETQSVQNRIMNLGASPVITAPYLGVSSRWDAADLIVNQPTYNEDVLLMQRDALMDKAAIDLGFATPTSPILEMSGKVEAQAYASKPFSGSTQSDIDVSAAEVDFAVHVSKWVNGLADIDYDNSPPNANNGTTDAALIANSRVYVSQAFLTVGNLTQLPFYGTMGLRSIPFGHYSSNMISDTYPQLIFKIKDPALTLGYHPMVGKQGPYATAFLFKGDTQINTPSTKINNYGADIGYLFDANGISGDIGFSGVANVADALGMQANGISSTTQFEGFAFGPGTTPAEILTKRVPGANVHVSLSLGKYSLLAEGNMATSHFATQDMTFNGNGAKPAAAHIEGIYSFNIGKYPSAFSIGYDHSWQALALALPQSRYITAISTSFFKDTIESLELKREINYSGNDTASGQNLPVILPGHYSNTITAQIGYYF